jgi:predicted dehydrogenase
MLKIAVAGCGYWGPNLIRNLYSLSGCKVETACDIDVKRLERIESLYGNIKTTTNYDDLVDNKDIDAIFIVTPVRFHFEMARKSLQANKHTFIEKPMALSGKECEELIALAEKHGLTLMIGHTFIYSSPVRKIKEIIRNGDLGDIMYIGSRRLNLGLYQNDINVAWDLAPHEISIILYVLDDDPIYVNCQGKASINKDIEDITNMTIDFKNGGFATIQSSWLDPNKVRETKFVGTKGMLVYDDVEPNEKIRVYDKRVETPPHYDTFAEFHYSYHYGDMYSPYLNQVEPLKVECQHFLDCIKSGLKPDSCGKDGLKVVQILEASSKSLSNGGGKVKVKI